MFRGHRVILEILVSGRAVECKQFPDSRLLSDSPDSCSLLQCEPYEFRRLGECLTRFPIKPNVIPPVINGVSGCRRPNGKLCVDGVDALRVDM